MANDSTFGMLDQALSGGRLMRGRTGGESDSMKGGGVLDPGSKTGRRLRMQGWVVGEGSQRGFTPDQLHGRLREAGLIPHGASVDEAVETYTKLAKHADQEGSKAHATRMAKAEAAHAAETYQAPSEHLQPRQFSSNVYGGSTAERMGLDF